ncbi:unnamed protein product [Amoebophrya sp. A25]|nr:unnamed protein product [Amoebophrya sp. A25]|eukprot:GSA25T00002176001.1
MGVGSHHSPPVVRRPQSQGKRSLLSIRSRRKTATSFLISFGGAAHTANSFLVSANKRHRQPATSIPSSGGNATDNYSTTSSTTTPKYPLQQNAAQWVEPFTWNLATGLTDYDTDKWVVARGIPAGYVLYRKSGCYLEGGSNVQSIEDVPSIGVEDDLRAPPLPSNPLVTRSFDFNRRGDTTIVQLAEWCSARDGKSNSTHWSDVWTDQMENCTAIVLRRFDNDNAFGKNASVVRLLGDDPKFTHVALRLLQNHTIGFVKQDGTCAQVENVATYVKLAPYGMRGIYGNFVTGLGTLRSPPQLEEDLQTSIGNPTTFSNLPEKYAQTDPAVCTAKCAASTTCVAFVHADEKFCLFGTGLRSRTEIEADDDSGSYSCSGNGLTDATHCVTYVPDPKVVAAPSTLPR